MRGGILTEQERIVNINIDLLIPNPYQPRKTFNEKSIKELAESIREYGILNPILVRKKNNIYEIVAGERRYRAAKSIGLKEIPAIIKDIDDTKMAEIALIENLQRENLTPIEEAKSYQKIINLSKITQAELATLLGKSQSSIANKIRLLFLPDNIQEALIKKQISEHHARSLLSVPPKKQKEYLDKIINEKLTVKELDNLINKEKNDIKISISDITNSIRKEEKESDNMNNGNFFPNFNTQMNQPTNMSLNNLNMQTINTNPVPQAEEMVMPTVPPEPTTTPVANPFVNQMPEPVAPTFPSAPEMPASAPTPEVNEVPAQPIEEPAPIVEPIQPLFNMNLQNNITPDINTSVAPMNATTSTTAEPVAPTFPQVTEMPASAPTPEVNEVPAQPIEEPAPIVEPIQPLFNMNLQNNITPDINTSVAPMNETTSTTAEPVAPTFPQVTEMPVSAPTPEVNEVPAQPIEEPAIPTAVPDTAQTSPSLEPMPVNNSIPSLEEITAEEPTPMPTPQPSSPVVETPIAPVPEPAQETYEVPVMSPMMNNTSVPTPEDNLTKTTNLLNQNNIPYKLYSNETGHCIIIEL